MAVLLSGLSTGRVGKPATNSLSYGAAYLFLTRHLPEMNKNVEKLRAQFQILRLCGYKSD
jgi:hypothetical protein